MGDDNLTVYELIYLLEEIGDKDKEIYIQKQDDTGNLTTYLRVKEYVDGVIIWDNTK